MKHSQIYLGRDYAGIQREANGILKLGWKFLIFLGKYIYCTLKKAIFMQNGN